MPAARGDATPVEIRKRGGAMLVVRWRDGHASEFPAPWLRARCPCAQCVDEVTGERRVGEAEIAPAVEVRGVEVVGRYAIRVTWSDGHATGLYSFDLLRALCPCPSCASGESRAEA